MKNIGFPGKFPHKPIQWMMSAFWIFTSSMDFWRGLNGYISSYSQSIERSLRICPSSSSIPCWSSSKVMSPGQETGPCYVSIGTVPLFWSPPNINILNTSELVYIYIWSRVPCSHPPPWDWGGVWCPCGGVYTYIHTYIPTYLPTYLRTYIHTYTDTHTHTYIHTLHYIT